MKMEILLLKNFCQTMLFKACLMMMMTMEPMEAHHMTGVQENMTSTLLPQKWTVLQKFIQNLLRSTTNHQISSVVMEMKFHFTM